MARKKKKKKNILLVHLKAILLSIILLLIVFILGFVSMNIIMKIVVAHKNEVVTPMLVNKTFNSAVKICKKNGLYAKVDKYINSKDIPKDKVISQEPHAGIKIKKYRTVKLVVSKGPELVRIPYLDNLSASEAKIKLENAGLFLGKKKYQYSKDLPKGKIIYSQPYADDLIPRGGKVDIVISLGKLKTGKSNSSRYRKYLKEE
jgi:serine/threonine-protein kinase